MSTRLNLRYRLVFLLVLWLCLIIWAGCSQVDRDWSRAERLDTIAGYEQFLRVNGNSEMADSAVTRIKQLHYDDVRTLNIRPAYEVFLKKYSRGALADSARFHIAQLSFNRARLKHQRFVYEAFLQDQPGSPQVLQAMEAIQELDSKRKPCCKDVYRLRLSVKQQYRGPQGNLEAIELPIAETVEKILFASGVQVVAEDSETAQGTVFITIDGVLTDFDSVSIDLDARGVHALLKGNVLFDFNSDTSIQSRFSVNKVWSDNRSALSGDVTQMLLAAFWKQGSFTSCFTDLAARLFGPAPLIGLMWEADSLAFRVQESLEQSSPEIESDLIRVLEGDYDLMKFMAAPILGKIGTNAADSVLLVNLRTTDVMLKQQVIQALGDLNAVSAIRELEKLIDFPNPELRHATAVALSKMKSDSAKSLLFRMCRDADPQVAMAAVAGIGVQRDSSAVDSLILLLDSGNRDVQAVTMEALYQIGQPCSETLLHVLENGSSQARWRAANILGRLLEPRAIPLLIKALGDGRGNSFLAWKAREFLSGYGAPALPAVLEAVDDETIRSEALIVLGSIESPESLETLLKWLSDTDLEVRRGAAEGLGVLGHEDAVPALLKALESKDIILKIKVMESLASIGDPRAFSEMKKLLESDDETIKLHALQTIGALKQTRGRQLILSVLDHHNVDLVCRAIEILGESPDTGILKRLIPLTAHESPKVKRLVTRVLMTHQQLSVDPLIQAVRTGERDVQREAGALLGRIRDPRSIPVLIQGFALNDVYLTSRFKYALYQIGEPAVNPLIQALSHNNKNIQHRAAETLENLKDSRTLLPMIRALNSQDVVLSRIAAKNLGVLKKSQATAALIRALKRQDIKLRILCVEALGLIGDPESATKIRPYLYSSNEDLCTAVVTALGRIKVESDLVQLVEKLVDYRESVQSAAKQAVLAYESEAVPLLIKKLESGSHAERQVAANLLAKLQKSAMPQLLLSIQQGDDLTRWVGLDALSKTQDARAIPVLLSLIAESDSNRMLFDRIRGVFVRIGDPAVAPLVALLSDTDAGNRRAAAEILGYIKNPSGFRPIIPLLNDPDIQVQEEAAKALRKMSREDFGKNTKKWRQWLNRMEQKQGN